ncbi:MAG: outer membrane beta-barrel protein [Gammaproteobacteria bacterium]|nr:outer membrane beta-barrel protein [Gammaproteobacteria bacterium]
MTGWRVIKIVCGVLMGLTVLNPSAHAQLEEGTIIAEVYGGSYSPGPDALDDETVVGFRFGGMLSERVAVIGSLGLVEFDDTATDGAVSVDWDADVTLLDVTVAYVFRPASRFAVAVGGGIGGAFTSFDGELQTPNLRGRFEDIDEDSLTLNAVVGPVINLSSSVYLKPMFRARWFEVREDDEIDTETTLAVGVKW